MWLMLFCIALMPLLAPAPAEAYNFTAPTLGIGSGQDVCPGNGLVRRIVPCIKETILTAAHDFLLPFSNYIAKTVSVACILAVSLWGATMVSGRGTAPLRDGMMTALKVGFVLVFSWNFGGSMLDPSGSHGGSFGAILDAMDDVLYFVAGYVVNASSFGLSSDCKTYSDAGNNVMLVWDAVDCAIETLIGGIYSPFTLAFGIIGFLFSCLFSNSIGFTIGTMGISLILQLLSAIFKCVYIYVSAYMGVAFMAIISPLFIPTILFNSTKGYFEKWLKGMTSFMIQPIVLFAYMSMLLAAFDTIVFRGPDSLYYVLLGNGINDPNFISDGGIGGWALTNGYYTTRDMNGQAVNIDAKSLRYAGLLPQDAQNAGLVGDIANTQLNYEGTQMVGTMNMLGVGAGGAPRFFEFDIPQTTVNWERVAQYRGYPDTISYLLTVLITMFMAVVTGYIFLEMLQVLPFIGSAIAMGGGVVDSKGAMTLGAGQNAPASLDFAKNFRPNAGLK